jgi:membrane protein required for colicin V production
MALVDWAILVVLLLAAIAGQTNGFLRSFCGLGGLVVGLVLAAWNYARLAPLILPLVRLEAVADTLAFVFIALLFMAVTDVAARILSKTLHRMGLGCLDRIAGAIFGFFQGALLVTLVILVTVAFFPKAHWLAEGRLPRMFFGVCNVSTYMSPQELADRILQGLKTLESESPRWMHSHGDV